MTHDTAMAQPKGASAQAASKLFEADMPPLKCRIRAHINGEQAWPADFWASVYALLGVAAAASKLTAWAMRLPLSRGLP